VVLRRSHRGLARCATHHPGRAALVLPSGDPDGADPASRVPPRSAPDGGADRLRAAPTRARSGGPRPHHPLPRAETLDMPRPRLRRQGEAVHLLVDSTGLKLCGAGGWLLEKHGTKTRQSSRKLHIGMDAETSQIVAPALATNDVDDGSQVGPLLDQVTAPVHSLTADGAYDQEGVSAAVDERHPDTGSSYRRARPLCPVRRQRARQRSGITTCSA
jgi:Transposase DDE domain